MKGPAGFGPAKASATQMVLAAMLSGFLLANPDVRVEVNIDNGLTAIVHQGFDAGIRLNETVARDMIAVRVGPHLRTLVVGAPSYFTRHLKPKTPAGLAVRRSLMSAAAPRSPIFARLPTKPPTLLLLGSVRLEGDVMCPACRRGTDDRWP